MSEMLEATITDTRAQCWRCGAHVSDPCQTDEAAIKCELPDFCFPNGRSGLYLNPTPEMLNGDPLFDAIWKAIKGWDISRFSDGVYSGPSGNDARHIYDAVRVVVTNGTREGAT